VKLIDTLCIIALLTFAAVALYVWQHPRPAPIPSAGAGTMDGESFFRVNNW
jgi:hypothetical protein